MEVRHDPARHRYVAEIGDRIVATTNYTVRDDRVTFQHTEVDDAHEGEGISSTLVRTGLDDVRANGQKVVPLCPFVRGWIERHPEYDDLVDHDLLKLYLR